MSRPRLLDLFCGAGGSAVGYHRAGFDVTGVDIRDQPRYPFAFVRGDALAYLAEHGGDYDAVHASPPCQRYAAVTRWRGRAKDHPDLVPATLAAFGGRGGLWVVENVPGSPIRADIFLCGSMFGLAVRRHRVFQMSVPLWLAPASCCHRGLLPFEHKGERAYADAMGCDWMTKREAREAVPPAYTEFVGRHLLAVL